MIVHRRRAPVIGVSLMAFLAAGFLASQTPGNTLTADIGSSNPTAQVTQESTPPTYSPLPDVRGISLFAGLIVLGIGGGILLYAKRQ